MPIYEFYCSDCHAIYSFFARRVNTTAKPACPRCGRPKIERQISLFSVSKKRADNAEDSIDGIELILKLEEQYGEKISAENLKAARTVQDVVNALDNLMLTGDEQNGDSGSTQEK